MDEKNRTAVSKFLSYILRHEPAAVGLSLDSAGWVAIDDLLDACVRNGHSLSRDELCEVVATSPKQRFALSDDERRIRANQGHSTAVNLGYESSEPPDVLFHGTVAASLPSIRSSGLQRMQRHHVHLSSDEHTAEAVAGRRGKPIVLKINAQAMREAGHVFFVTPNGVWLTDAVPSEFIGDVNERHDP